MAFVPWKDRVTATPHRYTLTNVSGDTYDLTAVPGAISEAGIPVNAANLDKLIQRDGDDIKDTVVAFTEASSRANIGTGESTATLFGKIKKWYTDLKTHAFANPSTAQGTGTTTVPCDKLLKESTFARVYREFAEIKAGYSDTTAIETLIPEMSNNSVLITSTGSNANSVYPLTYGELIIQKYSNSRCFLTFAKKVSTATLGTTLLYGYFCTDHATKWSGWLQTINAEDAQDISGVKKFTASPIVPTTPSGPSAAVAKSYVDGLSTPYSKVIRNQTEFEALIGDPSGTWLGAKSVALVGQFTLSTANNSGIKIPATVKQIHGFNSAKITVTNFAYDAFTAKGGLWYDELPTTDDYSIRDLEVSCDGNNSIGFWFCTNLTNCIGTVTGTGDCLGFGYCTNLTNCIGTVTGTGNCLGFDSCTNLTNCTGTGTGTYGYGFGYCTNLTNCTGTGTGTYGYGFYDITTASNCRDGYGGSSTDMWGGDNYNIDIDTCCYTPILASNTTLNT